MSLRSPTKRKLLYVILIPLLIPATTSLAAGKSAPLEEVVVSAQKREQSLQDAPIAIYVLQKEQLDAIGVTSLESLNTGLVPSLHSHGFAVTDSTLVLNIRGNGAADVGPTTREPAVAIYIDGFYLARPQGLSAEVADLERIEVLRGPQGTLFGRNSPSGAVSLITRKPSDRFGFEQTVGLGTFGETRSVSRLNLPRYGALRAKIDYVHDEREGWVKNPAPGQWNYNGFQKDGGRLALSYDIGDTLVADYSYDKSRVLSSQEYFQFKADTIGQYGAEPRRVQTTRLPVAPLQPTASSQQGHGLTLTWTVDDTLTVKSLTGYRKLGETDHNNFGPVFYYNGFVNETGINQDQQSQEFIFVGKAERLDWVAGLYYFHEDAAETTQKYFSLDQFGLLGGGANAIIYPITPIDLFTGQPIPRRYTQVDSRSEAAYGQATWTAPVLENRLRFTAGARYTADQKTGHRSESGENHFHLATNHIDPTLTADYRWSDTLLTYLKWSSAYHAGGVNPGSALMTPYGEEKVKTWEAGFKSEWARRRLRANAAVFTTEYDGMQIDFSSPANATISETINAKRTVTVKGAELELTAVPIDALTVGLSYTRLIGHEPLQPNPLNNNLPEKFVLAQSPQHAGAVTVDYMFARTNYGVWSAHLDATSTSPLTYAPKGGIYDGYTLFNARLTLADIPVAGSGRLKVSAWGKNLTDEQYVVQGYPINDPPITVTQAFGTPRTVGMEVTYTLN